MKLVAPALGLLVLLPASVPDPSPQDSRPAAHDRVHLIELFTSQACSSCPAADELIGNLARHGITAEQAIAISWHVDLWDEDEFKDPFVAREAPKRHRDYARGLGCAVYTPMAVVDGRSHVVGSDKKALARAVAGRSPARLALRVWLDGDGRAQVRVDGVPAAQQAALDLHAVLVEDGVTTRVPGGENAGRELRENGVVRGVLKTASLAELGTAPVVAIDTRRAQDPSRCAVVAFVQDRESREVLQVARVALPSPASRPVAR